MPTATVEKKMVDVQSVIDQRTGSPILGDCTLYVNETETVKFVKGRASVPEALLPALAQRGDIMMVQTVALPVSAPLVPAEETVQVEIEQPNGPDDPAKAARLAQAQAHLEELRAQGELEEEEEEPKSEPLPEGFTTHTEDGQPRCMVATASGGQCKNAAAAESQACKLPQHQAKHSGA